MEERHLKLSELITKLQNHKELLGDIDVRVEGKQLNNDTKNVSQILECTSAENLNLYLLNKLRSNA